MVGAPLPLGIGASFACSLRALPGLDRARCSGALFYRAAFGKEETPMRQDVLFLSTNYFRLGTKRTKFFKVRTKNEKFEEP